MITRRSTDLALLAAAALAAACAGPAGEPPAAGASPTASPLVAPLGPGAVPSLSPTAATQYDVRGKVESVAPDRLAVTLDHEEIPGLMAAMKMEYKVSEASVLQGLKAGDGVHGRLEVRPGNEYVILRLEKR